MLTPVIEPAPPEASAAWRVGALVRPSSSGLTALTFTGAQRSLRGMSGRRRVGCIEAPSAVDAENGQTLARSSSTI